jgi:phage terminase Nu1 subunit (DNA packaging protein)
VRVNIAELGDILDVSRPTITAWTNDGMPYAVAGGKGKQWQYDVAPCLEWWADNKYRPKRRGPAAGSDPFAEEGEGLESIEQAERRKMVAQADRAELDLAKNAGRVALIEDVSGVIAEMHTRVKTKLLGVGNQVRMHARAFFGEDRDAEEQVVVAVEDVITDCLTELRDDPFGDSEEEGDNAPT